MNGSRIYAIAARKFASLRRDKRMFGFIILMPAIQILLFGIAIGQAPTGLDFAIVDEGPGDIGAIVVEHLDGSESLVLHIEYENMPSARLDIEEGELWGALHIHPNGTCEILLDHSYCKTDCPSLNHHWSCMPYHCVLGHGSQQAFHIHFRECCICHFS